MYSDRSECFDDPPLKPLTEVFTLQQWFVVVVRVREVDVVLSAASIRVQGPGGSHNNAHSCKSRWEYAMQKPSVTSDHHFSYQPKLSAVAAALLLAGLFTVPFAAHAATKSNPVCPVETAYYDPGNGENIVVPPGFKVSVFAKGLNFPVGITFKGDKHRFQAYVLESGHGLPSACNDENSAVVGGLNSPTNPFTPDILVFDQDGNKVAGPLAKPTAPAVGLAAHGPSIGIAFEKGFEGGRLFVTDSNQAIRTPGAQNNSSRIVIVDPKSGAVTPFIAGLPTGDHPAEQLAFDDGWIYWSQGSTTNSGVVGRDNGGGANQHDIPCQMITLSKNVFDSGGGVTTSGYSDFGTTNPGGTVAAFSGATGKGICDGAILRAKLHVSNPKSTIEPVSWGYRNPYGIRFAPSNHALKGGLLVTENGEDERGARPVNNSPDRLTLAQQNRDGSPDYHGWPDRFGFLDSTQALYNPVGGPGDDNELAVVGKPVQPVLAFAPQPITAPLALEPADVAVVGLDFVPDSFVVGPVKKGAALISREGDFGFSKGNGDPEAGHDIELVNFSKPGETLQLQQTKFAFNSTGDQAFTDPGVHGINRPTDLKFGPDGCAYLVDYGAVRDFGQSDPATKFVADADAPLVQIPGTGVIWKICATGGGDRDHDRDDDHDHDHDK
jgi:glucose/arabinose dehydrogenase